MSNLPVIIRAVDFQPPGSIERGEILVDIGLPASVRGPRDSLLRLRQPDGPQEAVQPAAMRGINAANLKRVHALLKSGRARGRIVPEGLAPAAS